VENVSDALVPAARAVLDANWLGAATRPSPRLYPHQWSWDAAFVAIGRATYDEERARVELDSLFAGQWSNGMLPHIVFQPGAGGYCPGPDVWRTDVSPHAPRDRLTSGIVNPPVHAIAAWRVHERSRDAARSRAFLERMLPRLAAWHAYLYRDRDPEGDGLVAIRHPWESGMDNSPAWDAPLAALELAPGAVPPYPRADLTMAAADQRPTAAEYDAYVHLVEVFKRHRYDELAIREHGRFVVEDPCFNALLVAAGRDLARIASAVGADPRPFEADADRTAAAIEERLWDERVGAYVPCDRSTGRRLPVSVAAGFVPLVAGVPSDERARALLARLDSEAFWARGGPGWPVPTCDRSAPAYSPDRYWRGPIWVNVNWLLAAGLRRHGFDGYADAVDRATLDLVRVGGFREYFQPETGAGLGSDRFSRSAALTLDLLA
jgi:hypothetical protein